MASHHGTTGFSSLFQGRTLLSAVPFMQRSFPARRGPRSVRHAKAGTTACALRIPIALAFRVTRLWLHAGAPPIPHSHRFRFPGTNDPLAPRPPTRMGQSRSGSHWVWHSLVRWTHRRKAPAHPLVFLRPQSMPSRAWHTDHKSRQDGIAGVRPAALNRKDRPSVHCQTLRTAFTP